ncbi:hypothetical protein CB1_001437009 [Camelus ferus]|nr:hypothetical protein CB1_001437009 [Camelus ferus]
MLASTAQHHLQLAFEFIVGPRAGIRLLPATYQGPQPPPARVWKNPAPEDGRLQRQGDSEGAETENTEPPGTSDGRGPCARSSWTGGSTMALLFLPLRCVMVVEEEKGTGLKGLHSQKVKLLQV